MTVPAEFVRASDRSLLVRLGTAIGDEEHRRVVSLLRALKSSPQNGVINLHPAYCSLLIVFDPLQLDHSVLIDRVADLLSNCSNQNAPAPRQLEVPVHYDGPDLSFVAESHGLTVHQAIELHASARYTVQFLGFLPGFGYLSGLPEALVTPRLEAPRTQVPAGSVGIAGQQTGIYPFSTPGGWRLIGRTPLAMFRHDRSEPALLRLGDVVRFTPVWP